MGRFNETVEAMAEGEGLEEMGSANFDAWITTLDEDVIQGDYGYEPGEFTVYPQLWRSSFDEGLTPAQAFRRALDAFDADRCEEERRREENWARIQQDDAEALAGYRAALSRYEAQS